jgi:Fur family ferric uptake transcriptional regulator
MSAFPRKIAPQKVAEVRDVFAQFLKDRKQRHTPERFSVLDEVYETDGHFDADELYGRLAENSVAVSRATVYNTLELLVECDLVVRHQFGGKHAKYEKAYSYWQHDHLICEDCGEVLEFCDPRLQAVRDMVGEIYSFDIRRHELTLYGSCRRTDCPNRVAGADIG